VQRSSAAVAVSPSSLTHSDPSGLCLRIDSASSPCNATPNTNGGFGVETTGKPEPAKPKAKYQ
jgi:hypothetical protein